MGGRRRWLKNARKREQARREESAKRHLARMELMTSAIDAMCDAIEAGKIKDTPEERQKFFGEFMRERAPEPDVLVISADTPTAIPPRSIGDACVTIVDEKPRPTLSDALASWPVAHVDLGVPGEDRTVFVKADLSTDPPTYESTDINNLTERRVP